MCGIVGVLSNHEAAPILVDALKRNKTIQKAMLMMKIIIMMMMMKKKRLNALK